MLIVRLVADPVDLNIIWHICRPQLMTIKI